MKRSWRKDLTDRPAFPVGAVSTLTDEVAGERVADKLTSVRKQVNKDGGKGILTPSWMILCGFTISEAVMWSAIR